MPSWTNYDVVGDARHGEGAVPWDARVPSLFFRGSSTGGFVGDDTPFASMHRQRLVALAANESRIHVAFVDYVQCSPAACAAMEARWALPCAVRRLIAAQAYVKHHGMPALRIKQYSNIFKECLGSQVWARGPHAGGGGLGAQVYHDPGRYTFSSRLMRTLRSGSLIFRAGLFTEWFDERLEPFIHYLPVRQHLQLKHMDSRLVLCGQYLKDPGLESGRVHDTNAVFQSHALQSAMRPSRR